MKWLPKHIPRGSFLVTADVESLYTNISHNFGLQALDYWITTFPNTIQLPKSFILEAMHFILSQNYFIHRKTYYHQIKGVAMGTNVAPTFANLVMGYLELKVQQHPSVSCLTSQHIKNNYKRFIDDIFFIWNDTLPHFSTILQLYNDLANDINLTSESSNSHIVFWMLSYRFLIIF